MQNHVILGSLRIFRQMTVVQDGVEFQLVLLPDERIQFLMDGGIVEFTTNECQPNDWDVVGYMTAATYDVL